MNFWLGLDRLFFLLVRAFLRWSTRATLVPEKLEELGIDPGKPVVYVLRDRSILDLLALERELSGCAWPVPTSALKLNDLTLSSRYFSIYKRKLFARDRVAADSDRLARLIAALQQDSQTDIQLVPVALYWGRRPEKENSLWKIIFSDNWSAPGFIRKFIIALTQGRQLFIQFNSAMSLRQLVDEGQSLERTQRKALRILRVHFRRQHEAAIGPDLSHRRTLANAIVQSSPVRKAIEESARSNGLSVEKTEHKARAYAMEIAADYSHTVIRVLELVLHWVWNRLYSGIRIYNMERLRTVARDHEIIYVPCHRSHIDYLLLSFIMYRNGLVPPHIAAGINLNLPVLGTILRRGGAFFMRRSFKGNPLYSAVFNEYMHTIITRGFSIEYFVEGGRSRSGRMLSPKTGMLNMTVRSYLLDAQKPVAFIPVYIGYEKVLESRSYISELHGKAKQKESIFGLIKSSFSFLRSHFGQVHVNFGDPILLEQFLQQHAPADSERQSDQWVRPLVNTLGDEVACRINAAAVANPINLMSLALLSTPKQTMDEQQLERQLGMYLDLLGNAPYSHDIAIAETSPKKIIQYAIDNDFVRRIDHPLGSLITTDPTVALQMTYIRNNTLHLFVLPGLICSLFLHARTTTEQELLELCRLLYPFFKTEFHLHWHDHDALDHSVLATLKVLEDRKLVSRQGDQLIGAPIHTMESDLLLHLGQTVLQSLERFYLTIRVLVEQGSGKLSNNQLEQLAQQTAHRLSLLHEFNSPEFSDKVVFRNFIHQLRLSGLIDISDDGMVCFHQPLTRLDDEAKHILSPDTRHSIRRLTRLAPDTPAADASV